MEVPLPQDINEIRTKAENGDASAQNTFGYMLFEGIGTQVNHEEAYKWYKKASDQGLLKATYNLGLMYEQGFGVERSDEEAYKSYEKAAQGGYAPAQYNLACCLYNGVGIDESLVDAVHWFKESAEQGDGYALHHLANLYKTGYGVTQSDEEAYRLMKLAIKAPESRLFSMEELDKWERHRLSKDISEVREELLELLKVPEDAQMTHYTSLEAGHAMLVDKSPLRLGHINAVNDPNEGKLLWQYLKRQPVESNPVFIGCFLPDSDSLNMWRFYSKNYKNDDACGCALTFDSSAFFDYSLLNGVNERENNGNLNRGYSNTGHCPQESAMFYKVVYVDSGFNVVGNSETEIQEKFNKLQKTVSDFLKQKEEAEKGNDGLKELSRLLGPIPYLIKDKDYKDENEHRIIITHLEYGAEEISVIEHNTEQGTAPRLYLELHRKEHLAPLKYVTLGPKAPNKEMMGPYWHHLIANKFPEQLKDKSDFYIQESKCAYK